MNILYIAYSCDPYNGSEDQIGWNIPFEAVREGHNVYVLTKIEQKKNIEKYCSNNKFFDIKFYYIDIPRVYKKIFKGSLYSARVQIWLNKSENVCKCICKENNIEVIHQITPIEMRSIGNYGKICKVRYVVGPIGGGVKMPLCLYKYAHSKIFFELLRLLANKVAILKYTITGKLNYVDKIIFSNSETKDYFPNIHGKYVKGR